MHFHIALFILFLTTRALATPVHKARHHPTYINRIAPKLLTRRSQATSSLPSLDRHTALAAQSATKRKFRNATALLAGHGTSPGYAIPSSLQNIYNRASDHATDIGLLTSQTKAFADPTFNSSSVVMVAGVGVLNVANSSIIDPLTDEIDDNDDLEYYGLVSFGSQAQPLQIDFDTGSADLWVPVNCFDCGPLTQLQASISSTYSNTGQPFAVTYGSGDVSGTLAEDTVSMGPFKVTNQYFGAVQSVSSNFAESPNDGLAGLAFSTIANSQKPTFFENLISQGFLRAPLFSVYMTRNQVHGSEICFGCVDVSKATGESINWVPVVSKTWWTVSMDGVSVNNSPVSTGGLYSIVDTGTSFIYFPDNVASAVYELIPGAAPAPDYGDGFYSYPCDSQVTIVFILGSQTLVLDPRDLNLGLHVDEASGSTCIGAIISSGSFNFAIIGDSFLKSYVSVYDYSHGARVGFVKSINE